ncbi:putative transcription factor GRF family [Arabidopsis thaliana]
MSDNFKRRGVERGLPIKCRCGAGSVVKTSETMKNPGRLFHCCPYGSKVDNGHLFKWTDIAMVEEIKEVECDVEKIQAEIGSLKKDLHVVEAEMESLACETRTCEAVACRYENEIETIKALAKGCEKEIGELKAMIVCNEKEIQSLRCFKNVIVFSLVLFVVYVFII